MSEWTDEQVNDALRRAGDEHSEHMLRAAWGRALLTLEQERDEARVMLRVARGACNEMWERAAKAEAEVARMRPVVDAAVHWAEQWSRDADNKALEAAVDAYRAGGGK